MTGMRVIRSYVQKFAYELLKSNARKIAMAQILVVGFSGGTWLGHCREQNAGQQFGSAELLII